MKEEREPSKDNQQFLDFISKSAKLVNGHYWIGLPLKESEIFPPDNRIVAEQRTLSFSPGV